MKNDITNSVFHKNDPWDTLDEWVGRARNFFAFVGILVTIAFFVGWITS